MQTESTKLIFFMNCSVLDFSKFASRMSQIAQILVLTFKIFWGMGREEGHAPGPHRNFLLFFFSLAIPGSALASLASACCC